MPQRFAMKDGVLQRERDPAFKTPRVILVAGASGGIGNALCQELAGRYPESQLIRLARDTHRLAPLSVATRDLAFDLLDEGSMAAALASMPTQAPVDLAMLATGWLHDQRYAPEKTYKRMEVDPMLYAYQVNAIGPALLLKHLLPIMNRDHVSRIGVLSARVGSISDNRLGGWHAYRASKAALNMLLKNIAIELGQKRQRHLIVGLQPGTTDTRLSAPFQRSVPKENLQTPEYTASQLVQVMERLRVEESGRLFDFLGLPFEP
jgi:NAD(P)-dependent dehydrogenase (short-subunit alcohol dehydrogenase family)